MNASSIYVGKVIHQRHSPKLHRLEYKVFSMFIDLDELPELDKSLLMFGHNRAAVFSIQDKDHGKGDGSNLKQHVRDHLYEAEINDADGAVRLLCYPRIFGYVFNPLSVFYCYAKDDRLRAVIYEVNNTHGERHSYVIPVTDDGQSFRHECNKEMFVSPFLPMDCRYHFHINSPGDKCRLFIHETHDGQPILDAWFTGAHTPLNDKTLFRIAIAIPFMTLKIIVGIHWEAFKLWRKGMSIFRHSATKKYSASFIK